MAVSNPYLRSISPVRALARATLAWSALALPLHLAWEFAQLRFYTIWSEATTPYIAYAVLHCTAGDVLIAASTFLLAAAVTRRSHWPVQAPLIGVATMLTAGLAYTAVSEWFNVYRTGAWAYAPSMPLVAGIGLAPLLQWVVVPLGMLVLVRRWRVFGFSENSN